MTRCDYIRIAEALRFARGHAMAASRGRDGVERENAIRHELIGVMAAAEYLANALQADNSRFNRSHFLAVIRGEKDLYSRPAHHCAMNGGAK
jgi:hypothetical protein